MIILGLDMKNFSLCIEILLSEELPWAWLLIMNSEYGTSIVKTSDVSSLA